KSRRGRESPGLLPGFSQSLVDAPGRKRIAGHGAVNGHRLARSRNRAGGPLLIQLVERRAYDIARAFLEVLQALGAGGGNTLLKMAGRKAATHAAFLLDLAEFLPGFFAKAIRQSLDGARAARRIRNEIEVALAGEDELGIARDPACAAIGQTMRDGVREH